MSNFSTIYLGHCNSPNHKMDKKIVENVEAIDGIDSVSDSYVDFDGKEYCIIAETKVTDSDKLDEIIKKMRTVPDLVEVIELRPV